VPRHGGGAIRRNERRRRLVLLGGTTTLNVLGYKDDHGFDLGWSNAPP